MASRFTAMDTAATTRQIPVMFSSSARSAASSAPSNAKSDAAYAAMRRVLAWLKAFLTQSFSPYAGLSPSLRQSNWLLNGRLVQIARLIDCLLQMKCFTTVLAYQPLQTPRASEISAKVAFSASLT
jgi:hypothetical protein